MNGESSLTTFVGYWLKENQVEIGPSWFCSKGNNGSRSQFAKGPPVPAANFQLVLGNAEPNVSAPYRAFKCNLVDSPVGFFSRFREVGPSGGDR